MQCNFKAPIIRVRLFHKEVAAHTGNHHHPRSNSNSNSNGRSHGNQRVNCRQSPFLYLGTITLSLVTYLVVTLPTPVVSRR